MTTADGRRGAACASGVAVPVLRVFDEALAREFYLDRDAPGGPTVELIDPFGNVLRFCQPTGQP